jgi:hypothetical protein
MHNRAHKEVHQASLKLEVAQDNKGRVQQEGAAAASGHASHVRACLSCVLLDSPVQ